MQATVCRKLPHHLVIPQITTSAVFPAFKPPLQCAYPHSTSSASLQLPNRLKTRRCTLASTSPETGPTSNAPPPMEKKPLKHHGHHPMLEAINESTKWSVSAIAFSTLLLRRDVLSAWCIVGSVMAALVCRILKFALNHSRPPSARKADPGMPSAHANSLAFLSTFLAVSAWKVAPRSQPLLLWTLSAAVPVVAAFLTWLRVVLGYHTFAQVVVGWNLGMVLAAGWASLGFATVLPLLSAQPHWQPMLMGLAAAAVAAFAGQNGARWLDEARQSVRPAVAE